MTIKRWKVATLLPVAVNCEFMLRKPNQERDEHKAASDTSFKFKFGFGENRVQRYSIPTTKANIGFIA